MESAAIAAAGFDADEPVPGVSFGSMQIEFLDRRCWRTGAELAGAMFK